MRGQSSQLNFEMVANDQQIKSISKNFQKLRDIRWAKSSPHGIYAAYKASQDFNKPVLNAHRMQSYNRMLAPLGELRSGVSKKPPMPNSTRQKKQSFLPAFSTI